MPIMVAATPPAHQAAAPPARPPENPRARAVSRTLSRVDTAIAVTDNEAQERYEIAIDGDLAGFTQYRRRPAVIAFVHTEIDPRFEGRGLGGQLVSAALDAARAGGLAVLPYCPFVKAYIKRHPEYVGLVPEQSRAKFGL
jgi:predicted GNAT family acetyltransferase